MKAFDPRAVVAGIDEMHFESLASFNQGHAGVFWTEPGVSPWELHPDDDELLYVLDGEVDFIVLTDEGPVTTKVTSGQMFVVPRAHWHRHDVRKTTREFYLTPGASQHSTADDPRLQSDV